ncbi:hypothetical protein EDD68_12530 [Melghiribacillus thermohalophilus]|uniref:Uncharacterized protein n=1 Tax=Melghiribacillus thermohalophilus TaxID=1324956 RepID=A0A4R3MQD4_9BACI|nr:hypothetical protein EDD68_12530 [Melghiribacillus thermohalophilus]
MIPLEIDNVLKHLLQTRHGAGFFVQSNSSAIRWKNEHSFPFQSDQWKGASVYIPLY